MAGIEIVPDASLASTLPHEVLKGCLWHAQTSTVACGELIVPDASLTFTLSVVGCAGDAKECQQYEFDETIAARAAWGPRLRCIRCPTLEVRATCWAVLKVAVLESLIAEPRPFIVQCCGGSCAAAPEGAVLVGSGITKFWHTFSSHPQAVAAAACTVERA